MLPMIYAPTAGELVERAFHPAAIAVPVQALRQWADAQTLAWQYWRVVATDRRISAGFRKRASVHAKALRQDAA